jgi:hypothetical protein
VFDHSRDYWDESAPVFHYIWSVLTEEQRTALCSLKMRDHSTLLHAAVRTGGKVPLVKFLLACPEIDAAAVDHNGMTALMESVTDDQDWHQRRLECATLILGTHRGRTSINARAGNGQTALHKSITHMSAKCLDLLLNFGPHNARTHFTH